MIDPTDEDKIKNIKKSIISRLKKRYQYNHHRFTPSSVEVSIYSENCTTHETCQDGKGPTLVYLKYYQSVISILEVKVLIDPADALIMNLITNDYGWTDKIRDTLFYICKEYYEDSGCGNLDLHTSKNGTELHMKVYDVYKIQNVNYKW